MHGCGCAHRPRAVSLAALQAATALAMISWIAATGSLYSLASASATDSLNRMSSIVVADAPTSAASRSHAPDGAWRSRPAAPASPAAVHTAVDGWFPGCAMRHHLRTTGRRMCAAPPYMQWRMAAVKPRILLPFPRPLLLLLPLLRARRPGGRNARHHGRRSRRRRCCCCRTRAGRHA